MRKISLSIILFSPIPAFSYGCDPNTFDNASLIAYIIGALIILTLFIASLLSFLKTNNRFNKIVIFSSVLLVFVSLIYSLIISLSSNFRNPVRFFHLITFLVIMILVSFTKNKLSEKIVSWLIVFFAFLFSLILLSSTVCFY